MFIFLLLQNTDIYPKQSGCVASLEWMPFNDNFIKSGVGYHKIRTLQLSSECGSLSF